MDQSKPDDLRAAGGMVSAHNDFTMGGRRMTFWMMSFRHPEGYMVSFEAEGDTDADALNRIRAQYEAWK